MPELPEVQTVMEGLGRILSRHLITGVVCHADKLRYPLSQAELNSICAGRKVREFERRGKYMIWKFTRRRGLVVHLGMSGRFRYVKGDIPLTKHQQVQFVLHNGFDVRYEDPRRFGAIVPVHDGRWEDLPALASLGRDPLDGLEPSTLQRLAATRGIPVKQFIMDQTVIAGIGNIYACEALFRARIHPLTPANRLVTKEWRRLVASIDRVLRQAIARGGTTLRDNGFTDLAGGYGHFQIDLRVYGRREENCRACRAKIQCVKIAGRSSFYCPACQPYQEK